jgi:hypothetical protein
MSTRHAASDSESHAAFERWSWRDVLERSLRTGVPQFQRGMVWDSSNRVALLESMYEGSPCGMFVTWRYRSDAGRPDGANPPQIGVSILTDRPLDAASASWLVDGQQRSRSLIAIFRECVRAERARSDDLPLLPAWALAALENPFGWGDEELVALLPAAPTDEDEDDDGDEEELRSDRGPPSWYVCIPALVPAHAAPDDKWWRDLAARPRVARYSAFRVFKEGALTGRSALAPPGLLPLALFFAEEDPFSRDRVAAYVAALERGDRDELQRELPWGPLWLTGRRRTWRTVGRDAAPLLTWLRAVAREADAAERPHRDVLGRLHALFRKELFAVGRLPPSDLPAAVAAYVRINRAGVRVTAEERAMAVLIRLYPPLLDRLGDFLHRRDAREGDRGDVRAALAHASDKTFGFGLWMQVVARNVVLAEFGRVGVRWLGAEVLERWTVKQRLDATTDDDATRARFGRAVEHASEALLLLDQLLSRELYFDHRMARPDVRQSWPTLELFARLDRSALGAIAADDDARAALAHVLHLTMLRGYIDQGDMQALCDAIHGVALPEGAPWRAQLAVLLRHVLAALAELSPREAGALRDPIERLRALGLARFDALLEEARSLQHPAVGWLYALERKEHASDFDWAAQFAAYEESVARHDGGERTFLWRGCPPDSKMAAAAELSANMYAAWPAAPEKQHIVPFSDARRIVNKQGTRSTASPANDVGNLTWISSLQNGFDYGFDDRWMVLDAPTDAANLRARGFVDPDSDAESAKALFERMGARVGANEFAAAAEDFATFCAYRRAWMRRRMTAWVTAELRAGAAELLGMEAPRGT